MSNLESLDIAGVPIVLRPPANPSLPAALIVLWHGFGIPNSEEQLAHLLKGQQVQAWKAYLGLPAFGKRLPVGGLDEIMRRQMEDYVLQLLLPTIEQAMQELPTVVRALQDRYRIDDRAGIGLFGFSAGGAAALLINWLYQPTQSEGAGTLQPLRSQFSLMQSLHPSERSRVKHQDSECASQDSQLLATVGRKLHPHPVGHRVPL